MRRFLISLLLTFTYSAYYFPFTLNHLSIMNSKMFLAVVGGCIFIYNRMHSRNISLRTDLLGMILLAVMLSLCSFFSVTINNTNDYVYVGYFMSMATWLGGAYTCIMLTRLIHGKASIYLVFQYLTFMCAGHCVLAILIDNVVFVKTFIDGIFDTYPDVMKELGRLYSFGVAFDTAGIRFSAVLIGVTYLIRSGKATNLFWTNIFMFIIISGIGSIISRTTIVGVVIGMSYLILSSQRISLSIKYTTVRWVIGLVFIVLLIGSITSYLYQTNDTAYHYLRYGFEGFFNYFERGEWETHSSNLLFNGLQHLPVNQKTWLIGDGYFADPINPSKFYMGIDMGYIRFVYYFGLIGTLTFILFLMYCTYILCLRDSKRRLFFIMMFICELTVWVKITTDIFCMFALLMLLTVEETKSDCKQE